MLRTESVLFKASVLLLLNTQIQVDQPSKTRS